MRRERTGESELKPLAPGAAAGDPVAAFAALVDAGEELPAVQHWLGIALEMVMLALFAAARPLGEPLGMLLGHYWTWHSVSDLGALFLPPKRRKYWLPFRFLGAFQALNLTAGLWFTSQDKSFARFPGRPDLEAASDLTWTQLRLAVSLVSLLQSGALLAQYGPNSWQDLINVINYCRANLGRITEHTALSFITVATLGMGCMITFAGEFAFRNHSDNGNWKVDTGLTSFQSGNGVTVLVKMWLFHHLIADLGQQALYSFLVMTLFCAQVPFMWRMYLEAPIPLAHLSGECMFVADFVVLVYRTVLDKKRA